MSGAALAVSQHSTDKAISVKITNGELTGVKALYEKDLQNENSGNVNVVVEGGTFNGGVYSKTCSAFVTGGTFSDPNVLHYLGDNANVNITLQQDVDLTEPIVVSKGNVTLDLNNKRLYNTKAIWTDSDWSLVSVQGGSLTIKGQGRLDALEDDCYAVDVCYGAALTIEGGVYVGNVHAVYVLEGTANIKGGEYKIQQTYPYDDKPYEFVLNCYDANYNNQTAKIVVTGGKVP